MKRSVFLLRLADQDLPPQKIQVWLGRGCPDNCYVDNTGDLPTLIWIVPADHPGRRVELELWANDGMDLTLGKTGRSHHRGIGIPPAARHTGRR